MTLDLWLAFAVYAIVTSITPGPNNTLLMASGLNHGVVRALPHVAGVQVGFASLVGAIGLGLGAVFTALPWLHMALKIGGAAYLLWLAWGIARSGPMSGEAEQRPPITFLEAALFQWVNPKAWVMVLGAISTYVPPEPYHLNLAIVLASFSLLGAPCSLAWVVAGAALRRLLTNPKAIRAFNLAMAAALVGSLIVVFR